MDAQTPHNKNDPVEAFIARWQGREGGQERANYVSFLKEMCAALDLPQPDPADATHERNDYVFERAVTAAVFAALAASSGAVTVKDIAAGFRGSKNLEKYVSEVLASLSRLGHVTTKDGKNFTIRRAA